MKKKGRQKEKILHKPWWWRSQETPTKQGGKTNSETDQLYEELGLLSMYFSIAVMMLFKSFSCENEIDAVKW